MSEKGHDAEDAYFARIDRENNERLARQVAGEKTAAAAAERKALHAGCCGKCGGSLQLRNFRGVAIDVCVDCGAVLLDPGELEQLAGRDESGAVASLASFFGTR
jgi:hypothetical protein